jgi:hypothetical protein
MIRATILYHTILLVENLSALIAPKLHSSQFLMLPLVHLERAEEVSRVNFATYRTNEIWTPIDRCFDVHW